MGTPTRFPFGLSTAKLGTWADFGHPSPHTYHEDFDDFNRFAAAEWTITRVGTTPTEALTDGAGGQLLLTTVASASSSTFLQKVGASFLPVSGNKCWGAFRFKVSNALDTTFALGLQVTDTTPLDVTDGMYFLKAAASTSIDFVCRKDATTGSTTKTAIATIADDTFLTLGFYYDGKNTVNLEIGGRNNFDLNIGPTPSAYLPDTPVRISFGVQNGGSTARTMTLDYALFAQAR